MHCIDLLQCCRWNDDRYGICHSHIALFQLFSGLWISIIQPDIYYSTYTQFTVYNIIQLDIDRSVDTYIYIHYTYICIPRVFLPFPILKCGMPSGQQQRHGEASTAGEVEENAAGGNATETGPVNFTVN